MQLSAEILIPAGQTVLVAGLIWRAISQAAQIASLKVEQQNLAVMINELRQAKIETQLTLLVNQVDALQDEIGRDRASGIRGALHKLPGTLMQMSEQISQLRDSIKELRTNASN